MLDKDAERITVAALFTERYALPRSPCARIVRRTLFRVRARHVSLIGKNVSSFVSEKFYEKYINISPRICIPLPIYRILCLDKR